MMLSANREAGAIAAFSGMATVFLDGVSPGKLITAFCIAVVTGTGYKLGTMFAEWAKDKAQGKPKDPPK